MSCMYDVGLNTLMYNSYRCAIFPHCYMYSVEIASSCFLEDLTVIFSND